MKSSRRPKSNRWIIAWQNTATPRPPRVSTRDSGVLVLAAEPSYREVAINRLGGADESFNATPAIAGNRLLLRSDAALYCVQQQR